MKFSWLFVLLFTAFSASATAIQPDSTAVPDSTMTDDDGHWYRFDKYFSERFSGIRTKRDSDSSDTFLDFKHATIELSGMSVMPSHKDIPSSVFLTQQTAFDVRLGTMEILKKKYRKEQDISLSLLESNFLFVNYAPRDLANTSDKTILNLWRFGFGEMSGVGYDLGNKWRITPYHSGTTTWTYLSSQFSQPQDSAWKRNTLHSFDDAVRFGDSFEAGLRIDVTENIGIVVAYDAHNVFPRHLFWEWAGSKIIEGMAGGVADPFIKLVQRNAPGAAPIVQFLLKNGVAYAFYELRKNNMNFPFSSAPSMSFDTFRFGATFTF